MEVTLIIMCCMAANLYSFIQQGPDSSSTSSCNSSTPSSPALVMTTHTPHSTTKQQFHFPGKIFFLAWTLVVSTKLQIQHGYDVITAFLSSTAICWYIYVDIYVGRVRQRKIYKVIGSCVQLCKRNFIKKMMFCIVDTMWTHKAGTNLSEKLIISIFSAKVGVLGSG